METAIQKTNGTAENQLTAKALFNRDDVKQKFQELLGKRASSFITSVLQIVSQNAMLSKADPNSIYHSAAVAATLDLPLNNNLGFAYIIPFNQKYQDKDGNWQSKQVAQFQLGYKGFIQLAQRSGQFKTISASEIYEGQLIEQNPLTGYKFDFTQKKSETVIGYAGFFQLINGFEKTLYMSVEDLKKHGVKFSQTFKKNYGLWKDDFHSMCIKTVLKLLLSKFAPLSVEMQKAVITDQGLINDVNASDITYVDHEEIPVDHEAKRVELMIADAKTPAELDAIIEHVKPEHRDLFNQRLDELTEEKEVKTKKGKAA